MSQIHSTAIIDKSAQIGADCVIGPYVVIGPQVTIGDGNHIGPHAVIEGPTRIGNRNRIFQFAALGAAPQDLKFGGEESTLEIGDENTLREFVTLHRGTKQGHMRTVVGSRNLFMACSHVAHDVVIGDGNVFGNAAGVSGHIVIGNNCIIGGLSGLHQFIRLGDHCFLGGGSMVGKDVPPYCFAQGDHAGLVGINRVGLMRHGFSADDVRRLKSLYRRLFFGGAGFRKRAEDERAAMGDFPAGLFFLDFILGESKRGIVFPRRGAGEEDEN